MTDETIEKLSIKEKIIKRVSEVNPIVALLCLAAFSLGFSGIFAICIALLLESVGGGIGILVFISMFFFFLGTGYSFFCYFSKGLDEI